MKVIATLNLNPSCRFGQYRMHARCINPYKPLANSKHISYFIPEQTKNSKSSNEFCISCDRGGHSLRMRVEYLRSMSGWCVFCTLCTSQNESKTKCEFVFDDKFGKFVCGLLCH